MTKRMIRINTMKEADKVKKIDEVFKKFIVS